MFLGNKDTKLLKECRNALQQAIIIGIVTLLVIIDTWRLALIHNSKVEASEAKLMWWEKPLRVEPNSEIEERN